ncbi:MAG TPA: nucleotidyltransferase family protein [Pyrinomonadaceae bacterium]|nr:nucleotidyltransferase family protein [Pyrinomonadaceae bacterium]
MAEASVKSSGRLVASLLGGSWRARPAVPGPSLTAAELERIAQLILASGAGALGWWRIRHTELGIAPAAHELRQAYRLSTLQAALHQRTIEQAFALLRAAGVEPIMVKGWAVARLYPEVGLRPWGDVDLCVRPHQFADAEVALTSLGKMRYEVDLHRGFEKFGGGSVDGCYDRSQLVKLGGTQVRVLCAEDHLRALSIHLLREGAWRPLWLCDVAAAVEARGADFDWGICLTGNRRHADWILCAVRAAHELLGANIDDTPAADRRKPLPRWLLPAILKEWESRTPSMRQRHRAPMLSFLRYPDGILKALSHRWPNPIEATVSMRAPFNRLPRLPLQFSNYLVRTAKFAAQVPRLLRGQ